MKRSILILTLLLLSLALAGCEETTNNTLLPTDPGGPVTVSPATNCAPTLVPGEIKITDASGPSSAVTTVSGDLFNSNGAQVCTWSISRTGNLQASFICRSLTVTGAYSFLGNIILNTGQEPTPVSGGCNLASGV